MTRTLTTLTDLGAAVRQAIDVRSGWTDTVELVRIRNVGDEIAISLHMYGTDISRVGSSARRYYN